MEAIDPSSTIDVMDEDFYEHIEAPKFVDLKAPDRYLPNNDRDWFCLRVGCDQKHEEEMDSEEIYKNFVLRVMAARSPNVRLQNARCKRNLIKCPQTVPAKPSRSRLPLISSISKKVSDAKVKAAKVVENSEIRAKAFTTPRKNKCRNLDNAFQSVRNPKLIDLHSVAKKSTNVVKVLVFNSPKKRASLKKLCGEQRRGSKRIAPSDGSRKILRRREVKSRVFDAFKSADKKSADNDSNAIISVPTSIENNVAAAANAMEISSRVEETMEIDQKENDDKENKPASDHNNRQNLKKIPGNCNNKALEKKTTEGMSKPLRDRCIDNNNTASVLQEVKYRKPKPTNPKPFRLRTDERGILKEANLEKRRQNVVPREETTASKINPKKPNNADSCLRGLRGQPGQKLSGMQRKSAIQTTPVSSNRKPDKASEKIIKPRRPVSNKQDVLDHGKLCAIRRKCKEAENISAICRQAIITTGKNAQNHTERAKF